MKLAALVVFGTLAALEWQAPAPPARTGELLLGVLRRDGVIAPFAAYTGRRWTAPWPAGIRNLELPISVDDVPERWWGIDAAPKTMTLWRDGVRAGSVNLTGPTQLMPMCEPRIGLKSDYAPETAPPPRFERPFPKDGLVVAGDASVEPIEIVERGSADANRALLLLRDEFNRRETEAARVYTDWAHPVKPDQRKLVPVALEAIYRAPTREAGWTAYYVEAIRQYPPGRADTDGCGLATFAHGWILVGPNNAANVRLTAQVTYCDRKDVNYMLPFGLIRANDVIYWVFQLSGFTEEYYVVAEASRGAVKNHVVVEAGVCPR